MLQLQIFNHIEARSVGSGEEANCTCGVAAPMRTTFPNETAKNKGHKASHTWHKHVVGDGDMIMNQCCEVEEGEYNMRQLASNLGAVAVCK